MSKRLIIGISGASGAVYGVRALDMLAEIGVETHLVLTKAAELTLASEGLPNSTALKSRASYVHKIADVGASIASGSFKTDGMLIAPCSVRTMGEIATGVTSNLLTRAADVQLKERRRVVLMLRETPYHLGHIRTMAAITEMGGIIFPPVPAFYAQLESLDAVVTQSVGRALDLLGFEVKGIKRWGKMSALSNKDPTPSIWDFALAFYGQDGVEADCLTAQDVYGLDVTFLIFALYRARLGQGFEATDTQRLAQKLTRQLVKPLRQRRRALKAEPQTEAPALIAATRAQLLAAELACEQTILQILHLSEIKGQPLSGYDGLIQCVRAAHVPLDAALDALLKRLAHAGQSV